MTPQNDFMDFRDEGNCRQSQNITPFISLVPLTALLFLRLETTVLRNSSWPRGREKNNEFSLHAVSLVFLADSWKYRT